MGQADSRCHVPTNCSSASYLLGITRIDPQGTAHHCKRFYSQHIVAPPGAGEPRPRAPSVLLPEGALLVSCRLPMRLGYWVERLRGLRPERYGYDFTALVLRL